MMEPASIWKTLLSVCHKATRPVVRKGWLHWLRFALLLAAGSYVGHVLSESDRFTDWRYELYQWQVHWQRRGPVYPKYTALVLLNDDDYWSEEYQARAPLKRDKLAALLDKLNAAGVNTVAFDVILESPRPEDPGYDFPDYQAEDALFFAAVKRMCDAGRHVVLATEYTDEQPPRDERQSIYLPLLGGLPCVRRGHIDAPDDLRKLPGAMALRDGSFMDSFALAITRIDDPIAYEGLVRDEARGHRFRQYLTPDDFDARDGQRFVFNGKDVMTTPADQLRQSVANKAVIVGGHWHSAAYGVGDYLDMWNSPGGYESGAMMHASYVEAMRDPNSTFLPISDRTAELIEWGLALALAVLGSLEIHAGWKWAGFFTTIGLSVFLSYVFLQNLGLFLDFFIPMLMIVAHTLTEEVLEMRRELRHATHKLKEIHK